MFRRPPLRWLRLWRYWYQWRTQAASRRRPMRSSIRLHLEALGERSAPTSIGGGAIGDLASLPPPLYNSSMRTAADEFGSPSDTGDSTAPSLASLELLSSTTPQQKDDVPPQPFSTPVQPSFVQRLNHEESPTPFDDSYNETGTRRSAHPPRVQTPNNPANGQSMAGMGGGGLPGGSSTGSAISGGASNSGGGGGGTGSQLAFLGNLGLFSQVSFPPAGNNGSSGIQPFISPTASDDGGSKGKPFISPPGAPDGGGNGHPLIAPGGGGGSNPSPPSGPNPDIIPDGGGQQILAGNDSYTLLHDSSLSIPAAGVLANDTGPNGYILSAVLVSGVSHGTLTLNSNGSFLYTPTTHYSGTDSFSYYATANGIKSNTATVTLTINDPNSPVTASDTYSVLHDQVLTVDATTGVLANDSDGDDDSLTANLATGPSHGILTLGTDGSFTYTPNAGYVGSDSFTYKASDGVLSSLPTTVSLNVTDNAPTIVNHTYGIPENTAENVTATYGLLDGASDADNDYLIPSSWTNPSHGTLQVNPDGSFTYTPTSGYAGSDSFQYTVSDGALTATATVTLNVHATNTAPAANADSYSVERNNVFGADPSNGVLANDTDTDGDPLTATLVSGPSHGTLTLNSDGSFDYTPNTNFTGTDTFTYEANDGVQNSTSSTVTLTVSGTAPTAADQTLDVLENTTLSAPTGALLVNVGNPDNMTLTSQDVTQPSDGTVTVNANGSFSYMPNSSFTGTDSFTYDLTDGGLTSSPATVTISVNASDTAPTASALSYSTDENTSLSEDSESGVISGGSDSDNDPMLATLISGPSNGTLTFNADGSFTYMPNTGFTGNDSFQYETFDGTGYSSAATVTLTVNSDVPVANNDTFGVHPNSTVNVSGTVGVLANDTVADGDALSATLVSGVSHGSLTLNSDGSFSYTPNSGFTGTDSFTYEASDSVTNSNVATVTLNVHSSNQAPTANGDTYSTNHNAPLNIVPSAGVLANDTDADNDPHRLSGFGTEPRQCCVGQRWLVHLRTRHRFHRHGLFHLRSQRRFDQQQRSHGDDYRKR